MVYYPHCLPSSPTKNLSRKMNYHDHGLFLKQDLKWWDAAISLQQNFLIPGLREEHSLITNRK